MLSEIEKDGRGSGLLGVWCLAAEISTECTLWAPMQTSTEYVGAVGVWPGFVLACCVWVAGNLQFAPGILQGMHTV